MNFFLLIFSLIHLNLFELNICERFHQYELFMYCLNFLSFYFIIFPLNYQNLVTEFLAYHYFLNFCFMNASFCRFLQPKSLILDPFFIITIKINHLLIINQQMHLAIYFHLIFLHYFESLIFKILFLKMIARLALNFKDFKP